jgi:hypothetical protein
VTDDVTYLCGCHGSTVGQSFVDGLLVCPTHGKPVAPFERAPERHRSRATVVIDLDSPSAGDADEWVDGLTSMLDRDDQVYAIVVSHEQLEAARS